MIVTETLIPVSEVAVRLAAGLGSDRQWTDTLNDMRLGRGGLPYAAPLLPVARDRTSRSRQPLYRPSDVERFIEEVRIALKAHRPFAHELRQFTVSIANPTNPHGWWRVQQATPIH